LDDEYNGYNGQIAEFLCGKLRGQLREDWSQVSKLLDRSAPELRTKTWCEEHNIEVREELLLVGIEVAESCDDISW
jgi:hypothetical protein